LLHQTQHAHPSALCQLFRPRGSGGDRRVSSGGRPSSAIQHGQSARLLYPRGLVTSAARAWQGLHRLTRESSPAPATVSRRKFGGGSGEVAGGHRPRLERFDQQEDIGAGAGARDRVTACISASSPVSADLAHGGQHACRSSPRPAASTAPPGPGATDCDAAPRSAAGVDWHGADHGQQRAQTVGTNRTASLPAADRDHQRVGRQPILERRQDRVHASAGLTAQQDGLGQRPGTSGQRYDDG